MSKRLIRIASSKLYPELERLGLFELNAVLETGNTHFGRLFSFDKSGFTLKDSRDHLHHVAFTDLYEVVYDSAQHI